MSDSRTSQAATVTLGTVRDAATQSIRSPLRLLVVEDEEVVGLYLAVELGDVGFDVEVRSNSEDALSLVGQRHFDAAILDVALPGMPGDQVARRLHEQWPQMPVVLATGLDGRQLRRQFADDRLVAVLEKPYEVSSLLVCLERFGLTRTADERSERREHETPIEMCDRHIAQGLRRVSKQRAVIESLAQSGCRTTLATQLLAQFEASLQLQCEVRERLRKHDPVHAQSRSVAWP